jgi:opacity protein-like surface antigen
MTARTALLAATILALPAAAIAQPITGLYVGAGAGYNILQNEHIRPDGLDSRHTQLQFGDGGAAVGSIGYGLGNGLRVEIEGDYRNNYIDKLSGTPYPSYASGNQETYGAMANALYDFDLRPYGITWMSPYVGAGVGYQWMHLNDAQDHQYNGTTTFLGGTTGNFAYQGIVGVAFPLGSLPYMPGMGVPGLSLTAEYRFLGVLGRDRFKGSSFGPGGSVTGVNADIDESLNDSFMIGVRYAFNAAPPPPPPAPTPMAAPAPAPSRTYLVFFDWDKATLTDRARQIVAEAAQASTHVTYTKIQVNGYTDTSGTPQYNQGLSIRRAQAVAAQLVTDGVPRTVISIAGFGETHLLVPTAQGVREPQNRRVEIIIQ